jgi:CRISPR-associated protein Cmr1
MGRDGNKEPIKSAVKVAVRVTERSRVVESNIQLSDPDAYALWPAREQRGNTPAPPAQRYEPGIRFEVDVTVPSIHREEMRRCLQAWLLFGGYGSRTRRGVGKIAPDQCPECQSLLPDGASQEALLDALGNTGISKKQYDFPRLQGAVVALGTTQPNALGAWHKALGWLKEFRQGQPANQSQAKDFTRFARVYGNGPRASISNWPEADKVRRLCKGAWSHAPRHNATPVWPRAGFGLPIIAQFQTKARDGGILREPANFELNWMRGGRRFDRLASPLIVTVMPLKNGQFAPCLVWLNRRFPDAGASVVAVQRNSVIPSSDARFDEVVARGDQAQLHWLNLAATAAPGTRLRTAFFEWLKSVERIQSFEIPQGGQ